MVYFKARWLHDGAHDDPVELFSELDDTRNEIRKVNVFADGRMQAASESFGSGDTRLSYEPIPSLDDINSHPGFEAVEIARVEFETTWAEAMSPRNI